MNNETKSCAWTEDADGNWHTERHKKAIALMRSLLAPNIPICTKSGAERGGEG